MIYDIPILLQLVVAWLFSCTLSERLFLLDGCGFSALLLVEEFILRPVLIDGMDVWWVDTQKTETK